MGGGEQKIMKILINLSFNLVYNFRIVKFYKQNINFRILGK